MKLDTHTGRKDAADHRISEVVTQLKQGAWAEKLCNHLDQDYVRQGIEQGFQIGVDETHPHQPATRNMQSAAEHPEVINEYLQKECALGNILGPFPLSTVPKFHINRFGVIPQKHHPGNWRLITVMSFPEGRSINDAIDHKLCSLSYIMVTKLLYLP